MQSWGKTQWILLVVDLLAIVFVIWFLKWKIQHKLAEVESRQALRTLHRQHFNQNALQDVSEE